MKFGGRFSVWDARPSRTSGPPKPLAKTTDPAAWASESCKLVDAQRLYPNLVPHGQKASASWGQVWEDEGGVMVSTRYSRPTDRSLGVKVKLGGDTGSRLRGIPVRLAVLLDGGEADLVSTS